MNARQYAKLKKKCENDRCSICNKPFRESIYDTPDFEEISYSKSKGGYYIFFHTKCLESKRK